MQATYQQQQTQLEIERVSTVNKVHRLTNDGTNTPIDPLQRQLLQQMQSQLNLIEKAQSRLALGQYGRCQVCQLPIEPERLEIFPYTEHCASCKRAVERQLLSGNAKPTKKQ